MEIPLFPLHTVLFPGIALPLHIFEDRYRAMVARCVERAEPFGVVLIRDGWEVAGHDLILADVGTLAAIRESAKHPDGRYDIVAVGTRRFAIDDVLTDREPYLVARATALDDELGDETRARQLTDLATRRFVRYLMLLRPGDGESTEEVDIRVEVEVVPSEPDGQASGGEAASASELRIPDDPTVLSYLLSGIVQVDQPRRQHLLAAETTEARLAELDRVIASESFLLGRRLRWFASDVRLDPVRRN